MSEETTNDPERPREPAESSEEICMWCRHPVGADRLAHVHTVSLPTVPRFELLES